ncbi:ATP-binding protein [Melaminivora jejuensis]|uniref:sensor histidine kinase n=1 Tax=Melaminivora jejuensis TaxID=1267217 RepID=UPI001ADFB933|nr:sensor histidine kinase [Melaminivora jejuensis]UHJ65673.1 sensor histidine kinase [Melaminivora jejuensis]
MGAPLVLTVSLAYLALLFVVAWVGDRRAARGRSLINSPWVYALSLGVYCTAWTYFGSVGRAASEGLWFLPVYLGPTMAMVLGWMVLRKIVRIAKAQRITSIADFIASRYGKSRLLAVGVTVIAIVGVVPYIALQLKAVSAAYGLLVTPGVVESTAQVPWSRDSTFYLALVLAGFTMIFGARHLDATERHEGMVAAIAFESVVKLIAFLAVGAFVTYGLFDGFADVFARAQAQPQLRALMRLEQGAAFAWPQWFTMNVLAMVAVLMLPRQFQIMVVENVHEEHLRRATWLFPAYLLAINVFVIPIALGGLLLFAGQPVNPDNFVLSLPLAAGQGGLALLVFIGGLSAATGMVIVESIAVSIMVSNELVLPLLLRWRALVGEGLSDLTRILLNIRRITILVLLLLGYAYFHVASEAYALVSIGLISFAAVAQFAPAALIGLYWRAGTRLGALGGLSAGFGVWVYTLMLPSIAKSGWLDDAFVRGGPAGLWWLRPEALFGLDGLDALTHSLFWSLLLNVSVYIALSLAREPSARETSQALIFVNAGRHAGDATPIFWRGEAHVEDLRQLCLRLFGRSRTQALFDEYTSRWGVQSLARADAQFVSFIETKLAGAVGGASARVLVASVSKEESLTTDDVLSMLEEASQLRAYSRALEEKSRSLEEATQRLREANEQLKGLDELREEFMSSVTHELRTPLTSIRALAELMRDDPDMPVAQRQQFVGIVVAEAERLSRLVTQVLDLAKIEAGRAQWNDVELDLRALVAQAAETTRELLRERGSALELELPEPGPQGGLWVCADPDKLQQVMLNLLSNAIKFVPAQTGRVRLRLQAEGDWLTVSVTDNGPGICAEEQQAAFDKFRQVGDPRQRRQGTGLGLPICRQIVEHYGGRVGVRSEVGQGATFYFSLPWLHPATAGEKGRET